MPTTRSPNPVYKDAWLVRDAETNALIATACTEADARFGANIIAAEADDAMGRVRIQGTKRMRLNVVRNHNPCEEDH